MDGNLMGLRFKYISLVLYLNKKVSQNYKPAESEVQCVIVNDMQPHDIQCVSQEAYKSNGYGNNFFFFRKAKYFCVCTKFRKRNFYIW